jgi:hypothetical protein
MPGMPLMTSQTPGDDACMEEIHLSRLKLELGQPGPGARGPVSPLPAYRSSTARLSQSAALTRAEPGRYSEAAAAAEPP